MLDKRADSSVLQWLNFSNGAGKGIVPNLDKFIINPEQGNTQLKKQDLINENTIFKYESRLYVDFKSFKCCSINHLLLIF